MGTFTEQDRFDLERAEALLESENLATRIAQLVGGPIEAGISKLPAGARSEIVKITGTALTRGFEAVVGTMAWTGGEPNNWLHKAAVVASGAASGAATVAGPGAAFAALAVELPFATAVMLRSIAEIARSQGEDLDNPESRLSCLTVFAYGGPSKSDDGAETGYFAARAALTKAILEAAEHLAKKGAPLAAPVILQLIERVAGRFSIQVTEKFAAQALPVIAAVLGGGLNFVFMDHFQDKATGHFIIRRLERKLGADFVREQYERARGNRLDKANGG